MLKNLKIKTGTVSRTQKEYLYYIAEEKKELVNLTNVDSDKKQVVSETTKMIGVSKVALVGAIGDLSKKLEEVSGDSEVKASEEFGNAQKVLAEAKKVLE